MNEIHNQKKRAAIKWVIVLTAIALLSVIVAFAVVQSVPAKVVGGELAAVENGGAIIGVTEERGIKLLSETISPVAYSEYGISPQVEKAFVLTATVEPSTAQNVKVDWSVSWVNAGSEWATGKTVTDYVTVTPEEDGSLMAGVACYKAFGEQVKIGCTYRYGTAKAECTVDYSKKLLRRNFHYSPDYEVGSGTTGVVTVGEGGITSYTFVDAGTVWGGSFDNLSFFNYSDYTVDDTFSDYFGYSLNPEMLEYMEAAGVNISRREFGFNGDEDTGSAATVDIFAGGRRFCKYCCGSEEEANKALNVIAQHLDIPVYTFIYRVTGTYSTFEQSVSVYFAESALYPYVDSMSFNNNNVIL